MQGQKIGYIRVSTIEQNTTRQLDEMTLDKVFTDKCSGKDTNRPQLALMLDFIREGDVIYVHSMDRLARNLDDLRKLVNKINNKNVSITFVKENLTFTKNEQTPLSTLLLSVMGAFAEFERSLIKERQLEGIAIAQRAGKYKGRTKTLNPEQVAEMKQMVTDRYKKVDIAKKFGISRYSIYRYLNKYDDEPQSGTSTSQKVVPGALKAIKILLNVYVENNNKFVRGKKKSYEDIENYCLSYYKYEKTNNDHEYIITIEYNNDKELDEIIDELYAKIASTADGHNCFIDDTTISTLDKTKSWY